MSQQVQYIMQHAPDKKDFSDNILSPLVRELHPSLNLAFKRPDKKRLQAKLHELTQELGRAR